jgi:adenosylcobinamide-GDP ribazoletransferase
LPPVAVGRRSVLMLQIDTATPAPPPRHIQDAALALVFLTRLPLPIAGPLAEGAAARAMGWFPLVGGLVGLAGGLVTALASLAHLPPLACALLGLAAMVWLTGGLHEDGGADVADGFGGGRDVARKLEIMRDSRVGSYGVLALIFSVGLRAAAIGALLEAGPGAVIAGLVAAGALSRAGLAALADRLPPARRDGLAAAQGKPTKTTVWLAGALGSGVALLALAPLALGWLALPAALAAAGATGLMAALARRQIGGHTGDVFGAAQQVAEIAALLTLTAWMAGS